MILPDLNLLLYAYQPSSPLHSRARVWWEHALSNWWETPVVAESGKITLVYAARVETRIQAVVLRELPGTRRRE